MASRRIRAIIWTNDGLVYWRIYASPSLSVLTVEITSTNIFENKIFIINQVCLQAVALKLQLKTNVSTVMKYVSDAIITYYTKNIVERINSLILNYTDKNILNDNFKLTRHWFSV